jgi:hypothetical protein
MKKIILLVVSFLLSLFPLFGQIDKNDQNSKKGIMTETITEYGYHENYGEYVPYKTSNQIVVKYDPLGNKIEETEYNGDGESMIKSTYKYDSLGNLIKESSYSFNMLMLVYTHKYDSLGNKIEWSMYKNDGSLMSKIIYRYDYYSNMIEFSEYRGNGSIVYNNWNKIYKYDSLGNKIEESLYNRNDSLDWKYTYTYDKNGNRVEYSEYDKNGRLESITTYKYDILGNKIEWSSSGDGSPRFKVNSEFDSNGNKTRELHLTYFEQPYWDTSDFEDTYKYDSHRNMIEYSEYVDINGPLKSKHIFKYDSGKRCVEEIKYDYEFKFGKSQKTPTKKTTYEYILY